MVESTTPEEEDDTGAPGERWPMGSWGNGVPGTTGGRRRVRRGRDSQCRSGEGVRAESGERNGSCSQNFVHRREY
ncbi:hypothetical protein HAX54_047008 [Datura stramonium]|uniref:Uncharacterized protein n=1 Tax=Datura stramonium TaxID=4076 RepID=A0ABS8WLG8_DATST|nr:hypothetical protein [Datura stramonium]